ncbi:MAG: hypothetical protein DCC64_03005 [Planctomycetota bacterium]|nr:MAG: hypothetical protein DCC64_03005 [Planctomycetota bacterium]
MGSARQRFDDLAGALNFGAAQTASIRESLNLLLPRLGELVGSFDAALKCPAGARLFAGLEGERRDQLQSLMASFILRTVNCNFDEAYCDYAVEVSGGGQVPPGFFALGLSLAQDFVCGALPAVERDSAKLSAMLTAWNRLLAVLKELTRP